MRRDVASYNESDARRARSNFRHHALPAIVSDDAVRAVQPRGWRQCLPLCERAAHCCPAQLAAHGNQPVYLFNRSNTSILFRSRQSDGARPVDFRN